MPPRRRSGSAALTLQRAADPFGHPLEERLQLRLSRGLDAPEHRGLGAHHVRAVECQHVEVNIEIERRPKPLDQRHGARGATRTSQPRPLENIDKFKITAC